MGQVVKGVMGGGSSKPATTATPQKTAMTNKTSAEKRDPVASNMQDRRRQTSARSTVMTTGSGLTDPAKTTKKELLGS